jgi:hypothetical protein
MTEYLPLAALGMSMLTFLFSTMQFRYNAKNTYVQTIERRVKELEEKVARYEAQVAQLQEENRSLLYRLFQATQESGSPTRRPRSRE